MAQPAISLDAIQGDLDALVQMANVREKIAAGLNNQAIRTHIVNTIQVWPSQPKNFLASTQLSSEADQWLAQNNFLNAVRQYNAALVVLPNPYGGATAASTQTASILLKRSHCLFGLKLYWNGFCDKVAAARFSLLDWLLLSELLAGLDAFGVTAWDNSKLFANTSINLLLDWESISVQIRVLGTPSWSQVVQGSLPILPFQRQKTENIYDPGSNRISTKLQVQSAAGRGRFMVTTEAISRGEILIDSEVYAIGLITEAVPLVCHRCISPLNYRMFPCRRCTDLFYCSDRCADLDWPHHKWLCGFLALFKILNFLNGCLVIFNTAMRIGFERGMQLVEDPVPRDFEDALFVQFLDFFRSLTLQQPDMLRSTIYTCLAFVHVMETNGHLAAYSFDKKVSLGRLFFEIFESHRFNGFGSVVECTLVDPRTLMVTKQFQPVGDTLVIDNTMINHSCEPNVQWIGTQRRQVVHALRDIAAGEEINGSYGPTVWDQQNWPLDVRQQFFLENHGFVCECSGCRREKQERAQQEAQQMAAYWASQGHQGHPGPGGPGYPGP